MAEKNYEVILTNQEKLLIEDCLLEIQHDVLRARNSAKTDYTYNQVGYIANQMQFVVDKLQALAPREGLCTLFD